MKKSPVVLVVDDDPSLLTLLDLSLRRAGYPTLVAANGADALELLGSERVGFMVTDGLMHAMDGFELSRRAKELNPELHIAMISAIFVKSDAAKAPIDRVFEKPTALTDLLAWLRSFDASGNAVCGVSA